MKDSKKNHLRFIVFVCAALFFVACTFFDLEEEPACTTLPTCENELKKSSLEPIIFTEPSNREIAIIGNGIAGTAAALNLDQPSIRVYGSNSFWKKLNGLQEVWQTSLKKPFEDANLIDPEFFDKSHKANSRIKKKAVNIANIEGLVRAKVAYRDAIVIVTPRKKGWLVTDDKGNKEVITGTLIIATGVLRPIEITEVSETPLDVRLQLSENNRIKTGDECLSDPTFGKNQIIGIAGAGGSSADCIINIIKPDSCIGSKKRVVVWGKVQKDPIIDTQAYKDFSKEYDACICRVASNINTVAYPTQNNTIIVNGILNPPCVDNNGNQTVDMAPNIDVLVESLGRYQGDPPPIVQSAAQGNQITYKLVTNNAGELVAIKVEFDRQPKNSAEMYLVGAAATWVPTGVFIADRERFKNAKKKTVVTVNDGGSEHPDVGFAVAAFMGAELARCINASWKTCDRR